MLVTALALDFLQYVINTVIWGVYHRSKETGGTNENDDFLAPAWINYPANLFFYLKLMATVIAYGLIIAAMTDSFWKQHLLTSLAAILGSAPTSAMISPP